MPITTNWPTFIERSISSEKSFEPHLHSEEELLFPACVALERQARPVVDARLVAHGGAHASVRNGSFALCVLADDYDPRSAVCATHGMLLDALAAFERDLRRHIDEENDVLFPRVRRAGCASRPDADRRRRRGRAGEGRPGGG